MISHIEKNRFSSRLTFLISAIGVAVGTGNIWRFPRIMALNSGENGAGTFLIPWIIFLFIWSIPLIISEYIIGRKFRNGTIKSYYNLVGKNLGWMGGFIGFVTFMISCYYSVVIGWCLYYFVYFVFNTLPNQISESWLIWNNFQLSFFPLICNAVVIILGGLIISKGVMSIQKVNKIIIPILFFILLICFVRSLTLPNSMAGIKFFFSIDFEELLKPKLWLDALTQNAWDTGAGWGLFLTYAIYIKYKFGIVKNAFITAIGNNLISLIAGIMIFSTVFSILIINGQTQDFIIDTLRDDGPASTGLTFIWIPQLFNEISLGRYLSVIFFLGLLIAGISSFISMIELSCKNLIDLGVNRKKSIIFICSGIFLLSVPSAYSSSFFSNQDFVWGIGLIISGIIIAFGVIKFSPDKLMLEQIENNKFDWNLNLKWKFIIKYIVPILGIMLVCWWLFLSLSIYEKEHWYNPFYSYSFMTCIMQWLIVILILKLCNKNFRRKFQI